jgi:glycerol-3-phosphate dehydrogenase (NAD(P)+)
MSITVGILGTGAWPLTIASLCSDNGYKIAVWCYREAIANEINTTLTYKKSLGDKTFKSDIVASTNMKSIIEQSDILIFGLASSFIAHAVEMASYVKEKPVLILTKGLLSSYGHLFISDYIKELCTQSKIAVLSGPNIASEILSDQPSATVIASDNSLVSEKFQKVINHPTLRVYTSEDVRGVEIGGVLKNIMAIAAGCCDGLGYGVNTKSALLTRGIQEIIRFSKEYRCSTETFFGLSGLGDLIATCHSKDSRNYKFGYYLGSGFSRDVALEKVGRTVEGINTLSVVYKLINEKKLELPIINEVYEVIFNDKEPNESINVLMSRMLRPE